MRSDTDIDECADNSGGCSPKANCINRPGSFTCTCLDGYTGDGFSCAGMTASKISHSVLLVALKVVTDRQTDDKRQTDGQRHIATFTFAISSSVRLSSVVSLSVTFVRPTLAIEIFGNVSKPMIEISHRNWCANKVRPS